MNEEEIDEIRQKLLDIRSELNELEGAFKDSGEIVELDQTRIGRLSRMDAMQAQQMSLQASRRRQQRLMAIEGALRRIDAGEYGDCFVCGNQIAVHRLTADPTNTRCVGCAEE